MILLRRIYDKEKKKLLILIILTIFVVGVSINCVFAADSSSSGSFKAKQVSQNDILAVSKEVNSYAVKNKKLPNYVNIMVKSILWKSICIYLQ